MTAVLEEIRQLEAAHARGDLSEGDLQAAKASLMDAIEEADAIRHEDGASNAPPSHIWHALLFSLAGLVVVTGLGTVLLGDFSLALTVAVTLLAALTVRAFQALDD